MNNIYYRQGDILFKLVNKKDVTGNAVENHRTVALGELTGHHHSFAGNTQVLLFNKSGNQLEDPEFAQIGQASVLEHQEHLPFQIEEGNYKIIHENEYNPFQKELVRVRD